MKTGWQMKNWLMGLAMVTGGAAMTVGMSGCTVSGGIVYDPYYYAWYDVYGYGCSFSLPRPGCNYYYNGWKIIDTEDPYYYSHYYLQYNTWYIPTTGTYYTGWGWLSPSNILYDYWGNALNSKKNRSRDIVADVSDVENKKVLDVGRAFAAKYSLSDEKGIQVARALNDWATLGKDRSRTEADIAAFTERLYGVDYNKVKGALMDAKRGQTTALRETLAEAAQNWGADEETMKDVLKSWYRDVPGLE
jgi:hypothetical protein